MLRDRAQRRRLQVRQVVPAVHDELDFLDQDGFAAQAGHVLDIKKNSEIEFPQLQKFDEITAHCLNNMQLDAAVPPLDRRQQFRDDSPGDRGGKPQVNRTHRLLGDLAQGRLGLGHVPQDCISLFKQVTPFRSKRNAA